MNKRLTIRRLLAAMLIIGVAVGLFGCHEMKVETRLNADGSGTRQMELLAEEDVGDSTITLANYREMMGVTEDRGWTHTVSRRKNAESDQMKDHYSFKRTANAADFLELAGMSGDIYFKGTNENPAFADVHFVNTIEIETGTNPRGRTITYRETFAWSRLIETLTHYRLEEYLPTLTKTYPSWKSEEINEWFGFVKGTFMAAVDDGIIDMGGGDKARRFENSIDRAVTYAMRAIRISDPDADDGLIVEVVWSIFVEWEEFDQTAEDMDLLGVVLATALNLTVRIDIPGMVVETNADRQETYADPLAGRQKLVWEIDPADAMTRPIEVYVKTEIPDR
jgi:hypothetical protein